MFSTPRRRLPIVLARRLAALFLATGFAIAADPPAAAPAPRWTANLGQDERLRPFDTDLHRGWSRQQNVVFLTPQRLAVYQVNQLVAPARLAQRDASGGAGNFFLEVRIFDVRDGRLLKAFRMSTNAEHSQLLPTHDGKMIVRTGDVLYVVSPDLKILASRPLPLARLAPQELWQIEITPSGASAVLVHQQMFAMDDPYLQKPGRSRTEVEIVDADTLTTTAVFNMTRPLPRWSAGEGSLVSPDPSPAEWSLRYGLLDFQGRWSPFHPDGESCRYAMASLRPWSIVAYGCGSLAVFSPAGEQLFAAKVDPHEVVGSVDRGGGLLALELDREALEEVPGLNFSLHVLRPLRIEAYELRSGKRLATVPVQGNHVYFAVSEEMALAVIEGTALRVFQLEP